MQIPLGHELSSQGRGELTDAGLRECEWTWRCTRPLSKAVYRPTIIHYHHEERRDGISLKNYESTCRKWKSGCSTATATSDGGVEERCYRGGSGNCLLFLAKAI